MQLLGKTIDKDKFKKIWVTVIKYIIVTLIPIVGFYLMEFYEHNPFQEVRQPAQILNIILFELIAWLLFFLTGGARSALRIEMAFAMVFGLTNHYVMAFRSTPFVPWDIMSVGTAKSVASEYDFTPTKRVVIVTLIFLLIIGLLQFLKLKFRMKWPFRVGGGLILLAGLVIFTGRLQDDNFQTEHNLYPFLFTPAYMTKVNGMAVTFAMDLEYIVIDKPEGYSVEKAKAILEQYDTSEDTGNFPNIIVIMDEAFSELQVLGELETSEDYMPFIRSLMNGAENTISGYADVSVCGGNTANSEFEYLTGNTMAFLPVGSIPYQQYIKSDKSTLASYLKELGYETYGQHPYNASGWCRDTVYPMLGIDNLSFLKDYNYRSYVRRYESDMADIKEIIYTYNNRESNQPMFLFNVTMQNHGGYTDDYDNFSPDVAAIGINSSLLNKYLSLVKMTDESIEYLISYFERVPEDTVIVFFGDHQPNSAVANPVLRYNGADTNNLTEEERLSRYKVPYFIWANFDIEEKTDYNLSLNYLGAQTLKAAGIATTPYMNFLMELQEQYSSISANASVLAEGADEARAKELLKEYKIVQYYYLFDWKDEE